MRPIAVLAVAALALLVGLPSLLTPSFAQITPAITTTASRPPVFLPVVIRAQSTSIATLTVTASATVTSSPTSQVASPTTTSTTIGATNTPSLPPPSLNNCQAEPNPAAAPNYPIRIVAINKSAETVTLLNVSTGDTINLAGWTMCSILGNQQHPVAGTLAPGEQRVFAGPQGNIWNNSQRDDGALYNPNGQLVS